MLRYETPPIPSNSKNASANPAAIFRPNVHMSSLLRNAGVTATSLNRFPDERNTDNRTNHVYRVQDMLHLRASHALLLGRVELCRRNPDVTFEVAKYQRDCILSSAHNKPTSSFCFCVVAKEHRQAVDRNERAADTRYSEQLRDRGRKRNNV